MIVEAITKGEDTHAINRASTNPKFDPISLALCREVFDAIPS
jgi:hypothetical protein